MRKSLRRRIEIYKRYLKMVIKSRKADAFKMKLTRPTAREIGEWAESACVGIHFTNVWRDIRHVITPGEDYDAEFDFLLRGQEVPEIVANYDDKYLSRLIKGVVTPKAMDERLASLRRTRPDGRLFYEEL